MNKHSKRKAYVALPWLQAMLAIWLAGCSAPPAEEGIREALHEMAEAIEARQAGPVVRRLSDDFSLHRSSGEMDKEQTRRLLTATLLRYPDIHLALTGISVLPDGARHDQAQAAFSVLATGGSGALLPETGQLYRVESHWQLDGGDWMLLHAKARRMLE